MYELPESITVFNSEEVLESLAKYVSNHVDGQDPTGEVTLDARNLVDIDGAGLQLLLCAYKTCELKNIPFRITRVNEDIMKLLEICGTKDMLEREEV